jgi:hypothetical protein
MRILAINIQQIIRLAGLAQIVLVGGSLAVPRVLKWRTELAKVQPLIKQMFWVYAGYILVINLCFGLISVLDATELTNHTTLAMLVTGFISAYWVSRLLIQFFYFDRTNFPPGGWYIAGEIALVGLFVFLSIVYAYAIYLNVISA